VFHSGCNHGPGLPVHCHTEEMGDRIGSTPGTVLKVA
jgi:hypothetical protein